jgi:pullulanase
VSGEVKSVSPARQHMLTFLARWMRDFHLDGIRMDSVENVANWDFVQEFKDTAHELFASRHPAAGAAAKDRFLVVGEELQMPRELITQGRLDGLWNERFQEFIRAALVGENAEHEPSFEWTVRRAIDCQIDGLGGTQAVNYLTSHDVEGRRKERLYNQMESAVPLGPSEALFDRAAIEAGVRADIVRDGREVKEDEVRKRADGIILHLARLRRVKLGFVCLLTSVGIPMILAGEEFADQHDLFDREGHVTHQGGKQVDPVNYSRFDEPDRRKVFDYVARLVKLRTSHPALAGDETDFIHRDFEGGKRVVVWRRGPVSNPVVVVANFSDYTTPNALDPAAEYVTPNWPATPPGKHWFEVTQSRDVATGRHDRESVFAWEAKVYRLAD